MRRASYSPDSFPAAASNVIDFPGAVLAFQRNAKGGMNLFAVEKEFRIRLTTAEVRGLNNVGDFIALIALKATAQKAT